jgi:hypothetical protein
VVGREGDTYSEAEARDEGERAAAPNGEHRDIKRAVLGSYLYAYMRCDHRHVESWCPDKPSKMGHGPLGVMYPESLRGV